eukprot:3352974-Amphidinium_carterae.1
MRPQFLSHKARPNFTEPNPVAERMQRAIQEMMTKRVLLPMNTHPCVATHAYKLVLPVQKPLQTNLTNIYFCSGSSRLCSALTESTSRAKAHTFLTFTMPLANPVARLTAHQVIK